jgi:hypothetical protein
MTIPCSRSRSFNASPVQTNELISNYSYTNFYQPNFYFYSHTKKKKKKLDRVARTWTSEPPLGIQVFLVASRLNLLPKVVMIPTTACSWSPAEVAFAGFGPNPWLLAAVNSISSAANFLSWSLHGKRKQAWALLGIKAYQMDGTSAPTITLTQCDHANKTHLLAVQDLELLPHR